MDPIDIEDSATPPAPPSPPSEETGPGNFSLCTAAPPFLRGGPGTAVHRLKPQNVFHKMQNRPDKLIFHYLVILK